MASKKKNRPSTADKSLKPCQKLREFQMSSHFVYKPDKKGKLSSSLMKVGDRKAVNSTYFNHQKVNC